MQLKVIDGLFPGIIAIGASATILILSPTNKIASILLAGTTGAGTGLLIARNKRLTDKKVARLEAKIQTVYELLEAKPAFDKLSVNDQNETFEPSQSIQAFSISESVQNDETDSINNSQLSLENQPQVEQVVDWLKSKDVTVTNHQTLEVDDEIFDRASLLLGEKYDSLKKFYERIKSNLSDGKSLQLNLSKKSQQEISDNTSFGNYLHKYGFLKNYRYNSQNKVIYAAPNRSSGKIINHFTGKWFERFVYIKVQQILAQLNLNYQCLFNPQIVISTERDFELDMVFMIEDEPLWIECKTGDYQGYIDKYCRFRKAIDLDQERAFIVILGISDQLASDLSKMYDITVTNQNLFLDEIAKVLDQNSHSVNIDSLENTLCPPRNIKIQKQTIADKGRLQAVLRKAKLRPYPNYRKLVLKYLIELVESDSYTIQDLKQIRNSCANQIVGTSNTILMEIFNTLILRECLLDPQGDPLYSYNQKLGRLSSTNLDLLEKVCLQSYAIVALLTDLNYFNRQQNLQDFQEIVGCSETNAEKIQMLAPKLSDLVGKITTVNFVME